MKKYLLLVIALAVFVASQAHAAISFDSSSTAQFVAAVGTTNITVGSGSNGIVLVFLTGGGATSTGATFDGVPMTPIINSFGNNRDSEIWYVLNPSAGVHTVSTSIVTAFHANITAVSLFGVNQSTPTDGNTSTTSGGSATPSSSLTTTVNGDWVFDGTSFSGSRTTNSLGSGMTSVIKDQGDANIHSDVSYYNQATAGPTVNSYVLSGSALWTESQVAIQPVPPTATSRRRQTVVVGGD